MNGYEEIKKQLEQVDSTYREAELRNILQTISSICEISIKNGSSTTNTKADR